MKKAYAALLALALGASAAFAHYHFVHYPSRSGPFVPIYEKYDLNALTNRTLHFFISEQGPSALAPNDTWMGLVSQIREAAKTWNSVETSELRLAFGGIATPGTPQSGPGLDVIFDEVAPGIVALGGPSLRAEVASGPSGAFRPILRSVVVLRRDLSRYPSYSDSFFLTLVHEFGHALGLQHTLTSGVMSTGITRATTRSKPLSADDAAGLSILYPAPAFAAGTGSIAGRVAAGGEGVGLASVVALPPNGPAISTLTHPDGTYRLQGLQPGVQYYVYAHPLPPPMAAEESRANIVYPRDLAGQPIGPGPYFQTTFFPGTQNPAQAFPLAVVAGQTLEGLNLNVQPRPAPPVYGVETYSFPGPVAVKPATLRRNAGFGQIVARGTGLSVNGAPAPGLSASVVGGAAFVPPGGIRAYPFANTYVQIDLQFNPTTAEGAYHMVFGLGDDIYVLPSAFQVVLRDAPSITGLTPGFEPSGARYATITGANLGADTRFLFDGQPALRAVEEAPGRFRVTPPAGLPGHRAAVIAVNGDGQSSLFLNSLAYYSYDGAEQPAIAFSPAVLPGGVETTVEITASGAAFAQGSTSLGFGSSDAVVSRLWVLSPNRLLANVVTNAAAAPAVTSLTVSTGLQVVTQPFAVQLLPANPQQLALTSQVVNAATGQAAVSPGAQALVLAPRLTAAHIASGLNLTLNGERVQILSASPGQIVFAIPAETPVGPAVLRLQAGLETSPPVAIPIGLPPPTILSAAASGAPIDAAHPARPAELITLLVANLAEGGSPLAPSQVRLTVGGIEHQAAAVNEVPAQAGVHQVLFFLNPAVPAGLQPLVISAGGRSSQPFGLLARGS